MIKWHTRDHIQSELGCINTKIWGRKSKEKYGHPDGEEGLGLNKSMETSHSPLKEWRPLMSMQYYGPFENPHNWLTVFQDTGCPPFQLPDTPNPVFSNAECSNHRPNHSTFTTVPSGKLYHPPTLTFYTVFYFFYKWRTFQTTRIMETYTCHVL